MTEKINEYFTQGLVVPAFQAERNVLIWQYIAEEIEYLKSLEKHQQNLYSFIQYAAQTNFVLALGKLFDRPSKKFPTRCILSFLELLQDPHLKAVPIIETTITKKLLSQQNCPLDLIESVEKNNSKEFPILFSKHYIEKYNDPVLLEEIEKMKIMRDKAEAHNEAIDRCFLEFTTTGKLLEFTLDIISVFGMAYHSTGWKNEDYSLLRANAERDASFIKLSILDLKRGGQ